MSSIIKGAADKVKEIVSKDGHHDTTVTEQVAPAVTKEAVHRHHTEQQQQVVDKEVHQDHYHASVQPIQDEKVLPTQFHDKVVPTEEREFVHGDKERDLSLHANEAAKFQDSRVVHETASTEQKASVGAERVHHHVHETIVPVVQRSTIEPHVTETAVPIHEVHHNAAQHHATTALPAVSMSEFKKAGGVLEGRGERQDAFEGAPKGIDNLGEKTA